MATDRACSKPSCHCGSPWRSRFGFSAKDACAYIIALFRNTRTRVARVPENGGLGVLLATAILLVPLAFAQIVSLRAEHGMLRLDVTLNGRMKVRALNDTGASYLSICENMASTLDLTLGTKLELETSDRRISAH